MTTTLYDIYIAHPRITTDSRNIPDGGIFFALKGEKFDGNNYAKESLEKGAAYAVIDNPALIMEHPQYRERFLLVDNSLTALQELAREHRRRVGIPILAIVGSNGKTTTKELTSRVLEQGFRTLSTKGNLNNHIGVPLTLLAMDSSTEFGVVEMGASACSEIALLCSIAEPNYGIITNIGRSHLEGFGGVEGIRRGKGELFDFLNITGGRAFVPKEDKILNEMAQERSRMVTESYSTSIADGVKNNLEGEYNRLNIAAAMAVGRFFKIEEQKILEAIASYEPQNHRSQRMKTERNTLILDCYNANPSSMAASIEHFSKESSEGFGRRVLILGDMLELGEWSHEEHIKIIELASQIKGAEIWLVGKNFTAAAAELKQHGNITTLPDFEALMPLLPTLSGALVLIKGSHSIGLERAAQFL